MTLVSFAGNQPISRKTVKDTRPGCKREGEINSATIVDPNPLKPYRAAG